MRKSQFTLERNYIITSTAAFIVNGIGHIHDVLLLCWVLINRDQFFFNGLNTIATLVNYTCKSLINLTPGTCFSLSRADPGFFLGGGALVSCSTSTPINHIFFFWQNTSCIRKPQVISGGGGGLRTPCTLPLDPPLSMYYTALTSD